MEQKTPVEHTLRSVWGSDANHVWAVGGNESSGPSQKNVILAWNGSEWTVQKSGTEQALEGIWASAPNRAWAVGSNGTILMWNGEQWAPQESGTNLSLFGLWGRDEGAVTLLVFGAHGALLH